MTATPNKTNILKWAEALESGQYPQATGALAAYLHTDNDEPPTIGYCCLGVACIIAANNGIDLTNHTNHNDPTHDDDTTDHNLFWFADHDSDLPEAVQQWLGIDDSDPQLITADGSTRRAITLNDDNHYTFTEIAAAIRRTYLTNE